MSSRLTSDPGMLIEIDQLVVSYGRHEVVHGVSLGVGRGEIVALLGPNGVGKTTTLLATCGLLRASSGTVAFDGKGDMKEGVITLYDFKDKKKSVLDVVKM